MIEVEPPSGADADIQAIEAILANWKNGWAEGDAHLATTDYAPDADWLNAFGVRRKGAAEIQRFLARRFARADFKQRRLTITASSIRFLRPDVALAYTTQETVGQRTPSGKEMPKRDTRALRVITKEQGKWLIASHFITDVKEMPS